MALTYPKEIRVQKRGSSRVVPAELKRQASECLMRCIEKASTHYNKSFLMPSIGFDLSGTTAGKAYPRRNHVQLNAVLYTENSDAFLKGTIPHEIAHLVSMAVYGPRIKPHGPEWQSVMAVLGAPANRCHSYDVTNARTSKTHLYHCGCQEYQLSGKKHSMGKLGGLACRKCKVVLRPGPKGSALGSRVPICPPAIPAPARPPCPTSGSGPSGNRAYPGSRTEAGTSAHRPNPPTEKMAAYLNSMANTLGIRLSAEAFLEFDTCSARISELKALIEQRKVDTSTVDPFSSARLAEDQPTERQIEFANRLSKQYSLPLSADILCSKSRLSVWISNALPNPK